MPFVSFEIDKPLSSFIPALRQPASLIADTHSRFTSNKRVFIPADTLISLKILYKPLGSGADSPRLLYIKKSTFIWGCSVQIRGPSQLLTNMPTPTFSQMYSVAFDILTTFESLSVEPAFIGSMACKLNGCDRWPNVRPPGTHCQATHCAVAPQANPRDKGPRHTLSQLARHPRRAQARARSEEHQFLPRRFQKPTRDVQSPVVPHPVRDTHQCQSRRPPRRTRTRHDAHPARRTRSPHGHAVRPAVVFAAIQSPGVDTPRGVPARAWQFEGSGWCGRYKSVARYRRRKRGQTLLGILLWWRVY